MTSQTFGTLNNFGQKVRTIREQKKLLLRQLAAYVEADTALVSKIERGERNATKEQVLKIAKFLNANEEELLALWVADKIEATIVQEPEVAYQAMKIVKKKLKK